MRRFQESGFTLIELLVVLAILGLMASIAMPFTVRAIEDARLRADARQLTNELRQLQQNAIDRREPIELRALPGLLQLGTPSIKPLSPISVESFSLTGDTKRVIFYPDGTSSGGVLRLKEGGRSLDIEIAWLTGAIALRAVP